MVLLVALLALSAVGGAGSSASASSAADGQVGVEVVAPAGSSWVNGRHLPLLVDVTSTRLLQGTLRVSTVPPDTTGMIDRFGSMDGVLAPAVTEQAVEIQAGATKQFVAVLPTDVGASDSGRDPERGRALRFRAEVLDGDRTVAEGTVSVQQWEPWSEPVAVLPGAVGGDLPATVPMRLGQGDARLVAVPAALPAAGLGALDPFGTVVAVPDDLDALTEPARAALAAWVVDGGRLLVLADDGPVAGLPDAWQPAAGRPARAGDGEVRLAGATLDAERWQAELWPTPRGLAFEDPSLSNGASLPLAAAGVLLGEDAGFHLPELGSMLAWLALYVALVGPVTFVVLGRLRRRNLAWVVVPVVAVVFTAAFTWAGQDLRNTAEAAHATYVELDPSGGRAYTVALVGSVTGGPTTVDLPAGWVVAAPPHDSGAGRLVGAADGPRAELDLAPGQFSLVEASGPASVAGSVRVEARRQRSRVAVTVHNDLDVDLHEVVVFSGAGAVNAGDVAAHGSVDVDLDPSPQQGPNMLFGLPEVSLWPNLRTEVLRANERCQVGQCFPTDEPMVCDNIGCRPIAPTTTVPPSREERLVSAVAWQEVRAREANLLAGVGRVTVAGWTDELPSGLRLDPGSPVTKGRTAVIARGQVDLDDDGAGVVRATLVRGLDLRPRDTWDDDLKVNGQVYRIELPRRPDGSLPPTDHLVLRLPADVGRASVWDGADGWSVALRHPIDKGHDLDLPLPAGAASDGVLWLRTDADILSPFNHPPGWQGAALRSVDDDELARLEALVAERNEAADNFATLDRLSRAQNGGQSGGQSGPSSPIVTSVDAPVALPGVGTAVGTTVPAVSAVPTTTLPVGGVP